MRVKDYEFSYDNGGFSCCESHVLECEDRCKPGDVISCDDCGIEMRLTKCNDGVLRWVAV